MSLTTIKWEKGGIKIIDQTRLPQKLDYLRINNIRKLRIAIRKLQVRGAPALGAAGALGLYLGVKDIITKDPVKFRKAITSVYNYLAASRPTARNLFWGLERALSASRKEKTEIRKMKELIFNEGKRIIEEDKKSCRDIGYFGSSLIKDKEAVLTICNAGLLATVDYGTALGVIYRAKEEGKNIKVYALETRPLLQGSRLTSWELNKKGVDVTVVCDNTAALLMKRGLIDKVIAGADRIALNGDAANKIGTYNLAILSRYHKIPFFIAAPFSTFDPVLKNGSGIKIEERSPCEVELIGLKKKVAPSGVKVFNPAFDVTENELISAFITDKGIIRKPYIKNIRKCLCV